jgi:hypothetical protein
MCSATSAISTALGFSDDTSECMNSKATALDVREDD